MSPFVIPITPFAPGFQDRRLALAYTMPTESNKRITFEGIAGRLSIDRPAVSALILEHAKIPAIRLGRSWIVTRYAYEDWERTCGTRARTTICAAPAMQS